MKSTTRGRDRTVAFKAMPNHWTASYKPMPCKSARPNKAASVGAWIERMSPAVVPRSRTDKDAIREPVRTIVSVGRASVWRIRVISIRANGRASHNRTTYANPYSHVDRSLRIRKRHSQKSNQHCISHVLHGEPPLCSARRFVDLYRRSRGPSAFQFLLKRLHI